MIAGVISLRVRHLCQNIQRIIRLWSCKIPQTYTAKHRPNMADLPKSIGWIGLGLMGNPMIRNLLTKMASETKFFVHDVVRESVDKLAEEGKGRVHACESSIEVADKSVRT